MDFKGLSPEKSNEPLEELNNNVNKSFEELKRLQQSLSDKHKNIEVSKNEIEQTLT